MANIKSSKKDIRRTKRRNAANSQNRSRLRTQAKKVLKAIKEKDQKAATALFIEYTSLLDKAAKTNLIHSKNADRKKVEWQSASTLQQLKITEYKGRLAQLVERLPYKQDVGSSILSSPNTSSGETNHF